MKEKELFVLFEVFLERAEYHTSEIRERLVCNSFLHPIRCHPNCFPQGREIILAANKPLITRSILLVGQLAKTLFALVVKILYRIGARAVREGIGGRKRVLEVPLPENSWLLVDHPAVIGGRHKKVSEATGYFPFIEKMEYARLIYLQRVYHISERSRFKMRTEKRVTSILGIPSVLRILREEFITACHLVRLSMKEEMNMLDRMGLCGAAISQLSFKTLEARMIGERVRRIIKKNRTLKGVITTFEGHAYEREVSTICAREGIRHIAFQHSPFLDSQYAVKEMREGAAPGVILFSSRKAYREIKETGRFRSDELRPVMVVVGGSEDGANTYGEDLKESYCSPVDMVGLPNGDDRELLQILDKAKELIRRGMLRRLVLRFHPMASKRHYRLAKVIERSSTELAGRLVIQENNRVDEEAYKQCFYSLYVSSSAPFKLLSKGIVPVVINSSSAHLSPQSVTVSIDDLIADFSESAYKARLVSARREFQEVYSRSVPEEMMARVAQVILQGANVGR